MTLKLNGSTSGSVSIDAPASTTGGADVALTLPVNDGDANQILQTNGSGTLSWSTPSSQAGKEILAWVNFNGTGTVAIRDHYNVSSITDVGTGHYTVNFTNDLPDANYSVCATAHGTHNGTVCSLSHNDSSTGNQAAGFIKVESRGADGSGATIDTPTFCVVCIS